MTTFDDVARIAAGLPQTVMLSEHGHQKGRAWQVAGRTFAWERPFTKADIKRFGEAPVPQGPILALSTGDLSEKEALLSARSEVFETPHFAGYPAVLVALDDVGSARLAELLTDAWLARAPAALAEEFLAQR